MSLWRVFNWILGSLSDEKCWLTVALGNWQQLSILSITMVAPPWKAALPKEAHRAGG
jgi:hypothetical protein